MKRVLTPFPTETILVKNKLAQSCRECKSGKCCRTTCINARIWRVGDDQPCLTDKFTGAPGSWRVLQGWVATLIGSLLNQITQIQPRMRQVQFRLVITYGIRLNSTVNRQILGLHRNKNTRTKARDLPTSLPNRAY